MMAAMETPETGWALASRGGGDGASPRPRKIALKAGARTFLVALDAIDWIEAAGNYLVFHAGTERYTVRLTMREVEPRLERAHILRIHKSAFVNLDRVKSIEPIHAGDHAITLVDGTELVVSRTYRHRVLAALDFLPDDNGG